MNEKEKYAMNDDHVFAALPAEVLEQKLSIDTQTQIRSVALAAAVKYHTETVIKDGAMYQAKKLEGANFQNLTDTVVLQTAISFERYLRGDYAAMADELVGGDFEAWMQEQVKNSLQAGMKIFADKEDQSASDEP